MSAQPLQFLLLQFAGWVNRRQVDVIDYLKEENRALREKLGCKPIRLNRDQRRRLAVKGKRLGRKALRGLASIATPDTILRWYRQLVADKCERHLRRALSQFVEHYHVERNHQGLDNELIVPSAEPVNENAPIECRERLGGLLKHYYRAA